MQSTLANLQAPTGSRKKRTRVGRGLGSGLGKTAGRGYKGQKSRSGSSQRSGFEGGQTPLYRRLPKFGFNNPFRKVFEIVNVQHLENRFDAGETVDAASLKAKGLISSEKSLIKVLGEGNLTKTFTVKAHKFSKSAVQKINQAGGQVEQLKLPGDRAEQ